MKRCILLTVISVYWFDQYEVICTSCWRYLSYAVETSYVKKSQSPKQSDSEPSGCCRNCTACRMLFRIFQFSSEPCAQCESPHGYLTHSPSDIGGQCSVWLQTGRPGLIPAEAKDFSSTVCAQTRYEAHPAFSPVCTGSFPGSKARPGRDPDHSPPSSAEVENE
jgi:hypothetical protein